MINPSALTAATRYCAICVSLIATMAPAPAPAWTGALPGGGELRVDPNTHRATRVDGSYTGPMWDGVHRLDDGSVVIIRDGTAVPTEQMLNTWESPVQPEDRLEGRPCEQLERLVCGDDNACRSTAACFEVRRMLNAERESRRRLPPGSSSDPEPGKTLTETAACEQALQDQRFAPCTKSRSAGGPSPCQMLVDRVCGTESRCADAPACAPARQLLKQETGERSTTTAADIPTPSGSQCAEAMQTEFFAPCEQP